VAYLTELMEGSRSIMDMKTIRKGCSYKELELEFVEKCIKQCSFHSGLGSAPPRCNFPLGSVTVPAGFS
jgi:hypothetical protein